MQGRTCVEGGAGEVGEAFRAPEMKDAGEGADNTEGASRAPGMKGTGEGAGAEMRAPLWEPRLTKGGAIDTRGAFRAPEMKGSVGGASRGMVLVT